MAAITIANRVDTVEGNKRVIYADVVIADTNTFATGLMKVDMVDICNNAAGKAITWGVDISGGNLTFGVGAGGPITGKIEVLGS
jgi:hypothetical protein